MAASIELATIVRELKYLTDTTSNRNTRGSAVAAPQGTQCSLYFREV